MKNKLNFWLKRIVTPDIKATVSTLFWKLATKKSIDALSEDARKVSVNAMGIGLVGALVDTPAVPRAAALIVVTAGAIIWLFGWLLISTQPKDKE